MIPGLNASQMRRWIWLPLLLALVATGLSQQQKQDIPDAPSAVQPPPKTFPNTAPATEPAPPPREETPPPQPDTEQTTPAPLPQVTTVPEGGATADRNTGQDNLYRIVTNVNQVLIPVMVKDASGRLASDLVPKDFSVYEDGVKQSLNFFTKDPFWLSAAVIFDVGMPDVDLQKVNQTFPALEGSFSQFDEVSVYTYSSTVSKVTDFAAVGKRLTAVLNDLRLVRGRNNGPPLLGGPMSSRGPVINGQPVDPQAPIVITPPREAHVLNDAVLQAALELGKRDKTRRKVIFIISDGRELRSEASYSDVLKVLLTNGISVYGVGVGGSAIPVYGKLQKLHVPRLGTGDILPKYANATGGEVFTEFSRDAIESTYAQAMNDARNQYTLGYLARAIPSSRYREVEVKVARPDCGDYAPPCIRTYAKGGYYPAPPGR